MILEIAVFSLASAHAAQRAGASRIELCASRNEGGTTPALKMLRALKPELPVADRSPVPVYVMIRPRGGDFLYTEEEFARMQRDLLALKAAGADGFVFGILREKTSAAASTAITTAGEGFIPDHNAEDRDEEKEEENENLRAQSSTQPGLEIDITRTAQLRTLAAPLPCTFHRAFDALPASSLPEALEQLVEMGFAGVLTSGGAPDAVRGAAVLRQLVAVAPDRIQVIVGGGVRSENLTALRGEIQGTQGQLAARGVAWHSAAVLDERVGVSEDEVTALKTILNLGEKMK